MLVFPNCKINLGLNVVSKRRDGFHNIETVFYPVTWCDALEVIENTATAEPFTFTQSGLHIDGPVEQNLIYKAWKIISQQKSIPNINVHLHKTLPMGAGLGGGSSDAAHFINVLDNKFDLAFTEIQKTAIASQLGSDCAFFINNTPVFASGKGNEFDEIKIDLRHYYILVVFPKVHSNTADAYSGLVPRHPQHDLRSIVESHPITHWKNSLVNDFEISIFKKYPEIKVLKDNLYERGAVYASMSGSGSAVFGIFEEEPQTDFPASYSHYLEKPLSKIL